MIIGAPAPDLQAAGAFARNPIAAVSAPTGSLVSLTSPVRVTLARVAPPVATLSVLLNPTTLRERQAVEWATQGVVGLPYEPVQYARTRNRQVSAQFYISAWEAAKRGIADFDQWRRFIRSFLYPEQPGGAPSRVAFAWPGVLTFTGQVDSVEINYAELAHEGGALIYTIDVDFFETNGRRYASDALTAGPSPRVSVFAQSPLFVAGFSGLSPPQPSGL